ncbi:OmpA family protein [Actinomyces glycerinitolerans]|uniref:OmpA-like domain-containing protein n=1 Tax=Actinomyces glycerinitolerans TaxID=1892869 RepID=A0A1M4RYA2_9ACTO|nr:Hypothetical protein ACGLYG10_1121 [Actinomyces glycerinitolerans]
MPPLLPPDPAACIAVGALALALPDLGLLTASTGSLTPDLTGDIQSRPGITVSPARCDEAGVLNGGMTVVGGYGSVITSDGDSSLVNDGEGGAVYEDGSVSIVNEGDGTALVSRGVQSIEVDAEQRAQAVLDALEQDGVTAPLEAEGFGETRPVAPNENEDGSDNPAGRQLNRRVEIYVPAF